MNLRDQLNRLEADQVIIDAIEKLREQGVFEHDEILAALVSYEDLGRAMHRVWDE